MKRDKKTIVKYSFSLILCLLTAVNTSDFCYVLISVSEVIIVFAITEIIVSKNAKIANAFNILFLFIINTENIVLCMAGERVRLIMLENISSFRGLSGYLLVYCICAILLLVFSCLPIKSVMKTESNGSMYLLSAVLLFELCFTLCVGNQYSPVYSVEALREEYQSQRELALSVEGQPDMTNKFYKEGIESYIDIKATDSDTPNIVIIFAEGLSQNIIEDERMIMPNVKQFQDASINFVNYFNHTAATYRGIISQLYSGYQRENLDTNSLVSIESILNDLGYYTAFINTEPKNADFTRYLNSLAFTDVLTDSALAGSDKSISDKDAFQLLFNTMKSLNTTGKDSQPFFISIYTYGTYNTFDSVDEVYGDSTDRVLNKFYNLDYQFGLFLEKFRNSDLLNNTIIVFTSDHCTYNAEDFREAFPQYSRTAAFIDRIPFSIYWDGVEHNNIDALGRNSLDMAPTIMDILGISEPNYFLGSSLFNPQVHNDSIENVYYAGEMYTSAGGGIAELDNQREETMTNILSDYFIATQQSPQEQ